MVTNFEICIGAQEKGSPAMVTNFEICIGTQEKGSGYGDQL